VRERGGAVITKQAVTAEQFWEMPEIPGKRFELVDGELVAMPTAGALHNVIVPVLNHLLYTFVSARNLGLVLGDNTSYLLHRNPDRVRIPDLSFIAWGRIPAEGVPEGLWFVAPDLAVEVVSPTDRVADVYRKVDQYLESGVRLVWVLWPQPQTLSVHVAGEEARELSAKDGLDGGDVLPGFAVRVGNLFALPTRP
jgi:Uma2 family endonuclease